MDGTTWEGVEPWCHSLGEWTGQLDAPTADDDELMAAALLIERARRTLDAASAKVLGELDARGTTDGREGMRTPRWLAHHAGVSASTAAARVKVARALRSTLGEVAALFDQGRLGFDHAKALADACNPRIAAQFPPVAKLFAETTEGIVFERWRAELRGAAELLDADGAHDPADDLARNRLSKADTMDETYLLKAQLVGADGLLVHQTIDTVADELFRRFRADEELSTVDLRTPARATLEALALVEICRRAMAVELESSRQPLTDVTLVVNADQPEAAHTPGGVRLQDRSTRTLRCDARLLPVVVDSLGIPLDLGRSSRLASAGQRRPTTCHGRARRRLRLPRLWPARLLVRRAPPRPVGPRRPHRRGSHGQLVPSPPRGGASHRLADARPT